MEFKRELKDFIEYVVHYKENVEEMEKLDRDLDNQKVYNGHLKIEKKDLEDKVKFLLDRQDFYLEKISLLRKEKNKLKKELKELKGE